MTGDDGTLSKFVAVDLLDLEKKLAKEDDDLLLLTEEDNPRASIFCLETTNLDSIWLEATVGDDNWVPVMNCPLMGMFVNEDELGVPDVRGL